MLTQGKWRAMRACVRVCACFQCTGAYYSAYIRVQAGCKTWSRAPPRTMAEPAAHSIISGDTRAKAKHRAEPEQQIERERRGTCCVLCHRRPSDPGLKGCRNSASPGRKFFPLGWENHWIQLDPITSARESRGSNFSPPQVQFLFAWKPRGSSSFPGINV